MESKTQEDDRPQYLAADLGVKKMDFAKKAHLLDSFRSELYSSINIAEINDRAITHAQASHLRNKHFWEKTA